MFGCCCCRSACINATGLNTIGSTEKSLLQEAEKGELEVETDYFLASAVYDEEFNLKARRTRTAC